MARLKQTLSLKTTERSRYTDLVPGERVLWYREVGRPDQYKVPAIVTGFAGSKIKVAIQTESGLETRTVACDSVERVKS